MHYTLNNKMWQPNTQHFLTLILCSTLCVISASPLPHPAGNQELDVLQIPLTNGKEIDVLTLGAKDQDQLIADRNKRTIGLLRELFPDITKEIDSIVNRIIAQVIRVAGPGLLNSVLAGNRGSGGARGSTTPSSSFDADFDDDGFADDDDDDVPSASAAPTPASDGALNSDENGSRVKIDLPTLAPDAETSVNKQIDEQANRIISKLLRTLGPTVLRTAIQGNSANAARETFDADFDDDDEENKSDTTAGSSGSGTRVTIELPTFEPDNENEVDTNEKSSSITTTASNRDATTEGATRRK
ncbi:uncharacterized protein LOC135440127 isoform X5 [Drosophila montana]|uniref:uncharacterized protein LOC135440127 isoform X5 n=1 Tax=Drosophila montana TaxID=40370 RepID=UPI00313BE61B